MQRKTEYFGPRIPNPHSQWLSSATSGQAANEKYDAQQEAFWHNHDPFNHKHTYGPVARFEPTPLEKAVTVHARAAVSAFESQYPIARGKAVLTSSVRTAEEQAAIVLDPTRNRNYLQTKKDFVAQFHLNTLPRYSEPTEEEEKWLVAYIYGLAGKVPGYSHVGGRAQDIFVLNLSAQERLALLQELEDDKYAVLPEEVTATKSIYQVPLAEATVFHVFENGEDQDPALNPARTVLP